jgi:hypothetical protein
MEWKLMEALIQILIFQTAVEMILESEELVAL